jgi:hypothetical protein
VGRQNAGRTRSSGRTRPCCNGPVQTVPADPTDVLLNRQASLQAEAGALLADPGWQAVFAGMGPVLPTGSYVSGLMCWPELDVMLLGGPTFSPYDMVGLLRRVVELPGVVGFDYHDERGPRSPTGEVRDERYHATITVERDGGDTGKVAWRIDLSVWLHDDHANVTAWHEALRERITAEQRLAVLRIKDVWHRRPEYPDEVGGLEVYTAVLDHGVGTPEEFAAWLAGN